MTLFLFLKIQFQFCLCGRHTGGMARYSKRPNFSRLPELFLIMARSLECCINVKRDYFEGDIKVSIVVYVYFD